MEQIPESQDINQLWDHIIATLEQAQDLFIPSKVTKQSSNPKHQQGTALDHKTIRKIKKKHRSWQRHLETKSGEKYTEYRRLSNQVKKKLTKKAKRDAEREIAKEAKTNPKKFWKYISKKTKIRQGIPDLVYEATNKVQRRMAKKPRFSQNFSVAFSPKRTPQTYQPYRGRSSNIGYPK